MRGCLILSGRLNSGDCLFSVRLGSYVRLGVCEYEGEVASR